MIPSTTGFMEQDFEIEEQPSRNYKMNINENRIRGFCDELEAMKQTVFRILSTERYENIIYSHNYGIETLDLYGQPVNYVCSELERRIEEALLVDSRITDVKDFEYDTSVKGVIHVSFTVHTVFGDFLAVREVNI